MHPSTAPAAVPYLPNDCMAHVWMMATTQVRGPQTPAHMYSEYTELYWANISQLGRHEGSRFRMMVHDTRLLLQRLAMGASFATDSGGGSAHSNVKLLPFLMQMGYQCLGDSGTSIWRQAAASLSKHITRGVSAPQASPAAARAVASPARESRDSSAASSVDGADYVLGIELVGNVWPHSPATAIGLHFVIKHFERRVVEHLYRTKLCTNRFFQ